MTTTSTRATKSQVTALEAKLNAAMELIAQMTATQATTTAQTSSAAVVTPKCSRSNTLGSKTFARDILELICVDEYLTADYRSDEEIKARVKHTAEQQMYFARSYIKNVALKARAVWATKFDTVAASQYEYIAPVSGMWPADYSFEMDGATHTFTFGAKVAGNYLAIY